MGSETAAPAGDRVKVSSRSCRSKKTPGKVPRRIHKAAREKQKRDQLNELFLDLGKAIDLDNPNNGKATVLRETIRLLGELLTQVDSLKRENVTLLSESNYITVEKNELVDETSALDAQIKTLQQEIDERANYSNLDISQPQTQSNPTTQFQEDHVALPLVSHVSESVGPVFVVPLHHESQVFPIPFPEVNMPKVPSSVSRPRPRYPSDSWPSHILTKQTNVVEDV